MVERGLLLVLLALGLALPTLAGWLGLDYTVGIATRVLILALAGISLNLILGYGGMVSFGHAAFFGTGAYVVAILAHHAAMGAPLVTWPLEIGGSENALV
ncbi:MAG TPA: branched-chain amino acid ABC transporter permease, partial [Kiloniellales bacterium]|nr:branched-chain amino acid ABC transporter permease [Kiloniellales bacterium]